MAQARGVDTFGNPIDETDPLADMIGNLGSPSPDNQPDTQLGSQLDIAGLPDANPFASKDSPREQSPQMPTQLNVPATESAQQPVGMRAPDSNQAPSQSTFPQPVGAGTQPGAAMGDGQPSPFQPLSSPSMDSMVNPQQSSFGGGTLGGGGLEGQGLGGFTLGQKPRTAQVNQQLGGGRMFGAAGGKLGGGLGVPGGGPGGAADPSDLLLTLTQLLNKGR